MARPIYLGGINQFSVALSVEASGLPRGRADRILERAIRLCADNHVLVVAAAGNDGCECLSPPAFPSVLAVGAMGEDGEPLDISNWGEAYRSKGVLEPG